MPNLRRDWGKRRPQPSVPHLAADRPGPVPASIPTLKTTIWSGKTTRPRAGGP
jgi:hypothetical protein